jgi:hypothetical protein
MVTFVIIIAAWSILVANAYPELGPPDTSTSSSKHSFLAAACFNLDYPAVGFPHAAQKVIATMSSGSRVAAVETPNDDILVADSVAAGQVLSSPTSTPQLFGLTSQMSETQNKDASSSVPRFRNPPLQFGLVLLCYLVGNAAPATATSTTTVSFAVTISTFIIISAAMLCVMLMQSRRFKTSWWSEKIRSLLSQNSKCRIIMMAFFCADAAFGQV